MMIQASSSPITVEAMMLMQYEEIGKQWPCQEVKAATEIQERKQRTIAEKPRFIP